jgi:parvulin-like peptidyl-prolyl isomerase
VRPSIRLFAALAALLLLAVGCGTTAGGTPAGAAATVDGQTVARDQLEEAVRELTAEAPDEDRTVTVEETQRQVLTLLIQARIIENLADEQDVEVSEDDVQERIDADLEQSGGEEAFREMLATQSFTLELYRDVLVPTQLRVDELRRRLAEDEPPLATRTVRHILVEEEDEAEEIVAELEDGADFAELASERSIDPGSGAQGGDLGTQPRGQYVPEFDDAAWEAEVDEIVGPVESQFGFHIIQVTAIDETPATELDVQQLDEIVGQALSARIGEAFSAAEVEVDPAFGAWDPEMTQVVPADQVGEGGGAEQLEPAPGGEDAPGDDGLGEDDLGDGEVGDGEVGEGELEE